MAFAAFAFFFEIIIGISGGPGPIGALLLIGLGLLLLTRDKEGHCFLSALAPGARKPRSRTRQNARKISCSRAPSCTARARRRVISLA